MLESLIGAGCNIRRIRASLRESRDDRVLPGAVLRSVIAERQALRRIEITGQKNTARNQHVAFVLHLVRAEEREKFVPHDRESGRCTELTPIVLSVIEADLRCV